MWWHICQAPNWAELFTSCLYQPYNFPSICPETNWVKIEPDGTETLRKSLATVLCHFLLTVYAQAILVSKDTQPIKDRKLISW